MPTLAAPCPVENDSRLPRLTSAWLNTPLGPMLAMADNSVLHLLEFEGRRGLDRELARMGERFAIQEGRNEIIESIDGELAQYFAGELTDFQTPIVLGGTVFQRTVWEELRRISFGEAISYGELAKRLGRPQAFRAVANANGCNQLAVVVPCHRVINTGGGLGGYAGGLERKSWLLHHEGALAV